jgi:hypothetical protein
MNYIDVADAVAFDVQSALKDEHGAAGVRLVLNYEINRWELWFNGPSGENTTAISECRTRVRLHRDGTFEVLGRNVPARKLPWMRR